MYCSIDPATTILEVAVHKGFDVPDAVPHVLTSVIITDPAGIHVVDEGDIFLRDRAASSYTLRDQEPFSLDTRLNPPKP